MSMYPWHASTTTNAAAAAAAAAAASGPRLETPSSSTQSALQMPGLRWLPSMISRATPLPTLSSNLRIGQQQQQQPSPQQSQTSSQPQPQSSLSHAHPHPHQHSHQPAHSQARQPVPLVVESRSQQPHPESLESDSDHSDTGARDLTHPDVLEDSEFAPSPDSIPQGATIARQSGSRATTTAGVMPNGSAANRTALLAAASSVVRPYPLDDRDDDPEGTAGGLNGDTSRKHGKRLTTLEEVSLFNICNRHASEFGQRSNLCKWWMTVTAEFTRDQGHPYSWHSVRRKVELVTKQRMKFLDEQRDKGADASEDLSHTQWRTAVDAWIPTWQRWEEAEARRIQKRDSRKPRKRKDRPWDAWEMSPNDGWRNATIASPLVGASQQPGFATPVSQSTVRLPPGFDNMFASQGLQTPSPVVGVPDGFSTQRSTQSAAASGASHPPGTDSSMISAMLETLGKLNRHLDSVSTQPTSSPLASTKKTKSPSETRAREQQREVPVVEATNAVNNASLVEPTGLTHVSPPFIYRLKEELRQEMRAELEKDRASLEEKLDSVQRTQEMILEMLRQEPA
ncbi:sex determining protein [Aspergillus sclerotioniger CBS 115572]|uniref:Sex determining protein n=1 Tax=Aspergillus sclerotioniger CBS 115572 TaxID=1450535 RepID=A0A317VXE6_9EURO|nr:sex determining protein [Aspergillus sclerotioniger CBS 115572]PWY78465.1 sex determining protein [Aspergillus sclerotioniger CBS 115572]